MRLTGALSQHFITSSAKAMSLLAWRPAPTAAAVASSVRWHLENPPADRDAPDFAADDAALASVEKHEGPAEADPSCSGFRA